MHCTLTGPLIPGGGGGAEGAEGAAAPARKTNFFSNIVFEFAELFLVAILIKKITRKSTN